MKISKFLAIFSWINTYALFWYMIAAPYPDSITIRIFRVLVAIFFLGIAVVSTAIQSKENK